MPALGIMGDEASDERGDQRHPLADASNLPQSRKSATLTAQAGQDASTMSAPANPSPAMNKPPPITSRMAR